MILYLIQACNYSYITECNILINKHTILPTQIKKIQQKVSLPLDLSPLLQCVTSQKSTEYRSCYFRILHNSNCVICGKQEHFIVSFALL